MLTVKEIGKKAKEASVILAGLSTEKKNEALQNMAEELNIKTNEIIKANEKDIEEARKRV